MVKDENGKSGFFITPAMLGMTAVALTASGILVGATLAFGSIQKDVEYIKSDRAKNESKYAPLWAIDKINIQYTEVIRRLECIETKVDKHMERDHAGR